jgi:hypothetical protein
VSVLICPDRPPRFASAHAIDRAMIVACPSQTELDLSNQRVAVCGTALVTWLIVRIVSVTVRIIAIGIVSVVWVRIVKERVPKIAKEEEPVIEVSMAEPITAKTMVAKTITVKAAAKASATKASAAKASAAKATTVKAAAKTSAGKTTSKTAPTKAAAAKATAVKATVKPATAKAAAATEAAAVRRHVRACKSTNCESNCHCNKFFVIHIRLSICLVQPARPGSYSTPSNKKGLVDRTPSRDLRGTPCEITFLEYNFANSV